MLCKVERSQHEHEILETLKAYVTDIITASLSADPDMIAVISVAMI